MACPCFSEILIPVGLNCGLRKSHTMGEYELWARLQHHMATPFLISPFDFSPSWDRVLSIPCMFQHWNCRHSLPHPASGHVLLLLVSIGYPDCLNWQWLSNTICSPTCVINIDLHNIVFLFLNRRHFFATRWTMSEYNLRCLETMSLDPFVFLTSNSSYHFADLGLWNSFTILMTLFWIRANLSSNEPCLNRCRQWSFTLDVTFWGVLCLGVTS